MSQCDEINKNEKIKEEENKVSCMMVERENKINWEMWKEEQQIRPFKAEQGNLRSLNKGP